MHKSNQTNATFVSVFLAIASLPLCAAAARAQAAAEGADPSEPQVLPVVEVVVYEDRALVTREGEIAVTGGGKVETITVGKLPPSLAETSLRAGLDGAKRGRVLSVTSELHRHRDIQDARLRQVEESRRQVALRISEVDDRLRRLSLRKRYVEAYETVVRRAVSERARGGPTTEVERWGEALGFLRTERTAIADGRRAAEDSRRKLAEEHETFSAELDRLRRPQERTERTAEVTVEGAEAGPARLRISYVIANAGWSPRYDARYDAARSVLEVTYFGEIRQRTGEDWTDARLVLSTARPSVGASRPVLTPLELSSTRREGKRRGFALREGEVAGAPELAVTAEVPVAPETDDSLSAESRENATSASFEVRGAATIPTDGRPHKVPIVQFEKEARTAFETVPRLARFVYLKCTSSNASSYPMLAGAVDVFRGSGFIGTSQLEFVAPGRVFEISLGIEESLKVRRAERTSSWDERRKIDRRGFDIEVANFGEEAQTVTVIENYPVADVEEVEVRLDRSTTPPATHNRRDGILRWVIKVPAGGQKTVHLEYTVDYPQG